MTRSLARGACILLAAAFTIALVTATAVRVSRGQSTVRSLVELDPRKDVPRGTRTAAQIWGRNVTLAGSALVAGAIQTLVSTRTRLLLRGAVFAVFASNAALIGAALAAYGGWLTTRVALHLPFECVAFSLSGAPLASRAELTLRQLIRVSLACLGLLVLAAVLEVYSPLARSS